MSLRDEILSLPADKAPGSSSAWGVQVAYEMGHRDARHAAAELAAEHESQPATPTVSAAEASVVEEIGFTALRRGDPIHFPLRGSAESFARAAFARGIWCVLEGDPEGGYRVVPTGVGGAQAGQTGARMAGAAEPEAIAGELLSTAEADARRLRGEFAGRLVTTVVAGDLSRCTALRPAQVMDGVSVETLTACWVLADRLIAADSLGERAGTAGTTTAVDEAIQARLALLESRR